MKMKTQNLGLLAAIVCAAGFSFARTGYAQDDSGASVTLTGFNSYQSGTTLSGSDAPPPPPWVSGSCAPVLSGSGELAVPPWVSGSGTLVLSGGPHFFVPPPWLSGSGVPIFSGSGALALPPLPPWVTGSGGPIVSGSVCPPPPWSGGTGSLPGGTFESLTVRVAFTPTSGTTTSASGVLDAVGLSGTDHGSLDVHTKGLEAGTYTVTAVTGTGTGSVTLGTFIVGAPGASGTTSWDHPHDWSHDRSDARFGGPRGIPFPDGLDPFDLASLAISDSNSNVLFTADLTTISNGAYDARTPIVSGTTVTATGGARIHAFAKDGVVTGALSVKAYGLPASTTYTYAIDGTDIGPVTTGTTGALRLVATEKPGGGTLPDTVNLFSVTSVTVHDASANVILSASF